MVSKPKSKGSIIPSRVALPFVVAMCGMTFYAGFLVGQRPLKEVPDFRLIEQATRATLKLEEAEKAATEEKSNVSDDGEDESRRQLSDGDPTVQEAKPSDHGESGEDYISTIPFQLLTWHPRAYYFPGFLPHDKCDQIVEMANRKLVPSGLALRQGEDPSASKDVRTSQGTFLSSHSDSTGVLSWLENKIAKVTMIPADHGEAYNVLRYQIGQKYDSHFDTFNPEEYGPQSSMRIASFLTYLSDWEEGGETMFPYEGYKNMDTGYNYKACIGLKLKPRKGDGLLFWSLLPNGTIDKASLHGSCPVVKGEKFVATKWIRDKPIAS